MKKVLTIAASATVGVALLVPAGQSAATPAAPDLPGKTVTSSGYTPPAIDWGECDNARLRGIGAECGMLIVPLDYDQPDSTKIEIAVSRLLHTDSDYKGMIAANPGGPGGSGLIYPLLAPAIPDGVGAKYDWYGFDPRGVGSSEPSLSCDPNYAGMGYDRPDYVPTEEADLEWWRDVTSGYSDSCAESDAAELLPHMRTVDVARDLDNLRKAEGQEKLNYYGFSYGTYLGQVYATMFPKQVGRFVWDGVLNAKNAFYEANLDQNVQFDKNMDTYWKYLADNDAAFGLGTDWTAIRSGYYDLLDELDANPAANGQLGPDELGDVMLSAGYYVYGWVELGHAYAKLVNEGDGSDIIAQYAGPGDDNSFAVYNGVQCTDAKWPNWKKTERDAWRLHEEHPFLTWGNTWFNAPCLNWPAESHKAFKVKGNNVKSKILMIGETNDAATVFSGALVTRRTFRTSFLIEGVGGTTHSGSLSGIACTDDTIARYLDTGELPRRRPGNQSDMKCDPVPAPQPAPLAAAKNRSFKAGTTDRMPAVLRADLLKAQTIGR
ncbi:alpha/beta hydrolase [Nocardioides sp. JQ2195]|uniref:alpha/beta fold hydrolase n=1 Tax=Nocardioides sp. JQ2195 TaxID=2592334 RepID=UPI00143E2A28|nr:alpha/beta fold hydrolase [Nocardioides sp. JQ2195]QIX27879.1 alpha/beta hydrolase [Nocardioides sp. JQ2195]